MYSVRLTSTNLFLLMCFWGGFFLLFFGFVYLFISSFFHLSRFLNGRVHESRHPPDPIFRVFVPEAEPVSKRSHSFIQSNSVFFLFLFFCKKIKVWRRFCGTRGACVHHLKKEKRNSSSLIRLSFVQRCSQKRSNSTYVLCVSRWRECRVMFSGWGSRRRRRRKQKLIFFRFVTLWLRKKEEEKTNKIEFFFGQQNDYVV